MRSGPPAGCGWVSRYASQRPAVVTPFCTSFSSEISWGTVALFTSCSTPLVLPRLGLLSGRKSTAKIAHAMRDAREGHSVTYLQSEEVPAGIHEHRAEDRPRRTRDGPIPKLVERIGRTQDHARTQLAEICSNIDWPRRFGRCKTVYQALCKQENSFFLAALLGQRTAVQRAPRRITSRSQISRGVPVGLGLSGQKRAPF